MESGWCEQEGESPDKRRCHKTGNKKHFISHKVRFSVSHLAGWQARLPQRNTNKIENFNLGEDSRVLRCHAPEDSLDELVGTHCLSVGLEEIS